MFYLLAPVKKTEKITRDPKTGKGLIVLFIKKHYFHLKNTSKM